MCTTLYYCEDAKKFKDAFEECQEKLASTAGGGDAELAAKMEKLEVEGEENAGEEEKARSLSTVLTHVLLHVTTCWLTCSIQWEIVQWKFPLNDQFVCLIDCVWVALLDFVLVLAAWQSTKEKAEEDKEEDKSEETKGEKEDAPTDGDADHTSPQSS